MNIKVFNLVSNLVSLIVTILTILVLSIGSNVTAQTTPTNQQMNPTTEQIEIFFDPQYQKIAECVRKAYTQNNGNTVTIAEFPKSSSRQKTSYDEVKIRIRLKQVCQDLEMIDSNNLKTVVSCLDGIELIPGVGWNQALQSRLQRCIHATQNTLGTHRQAFVDCFIRKRFNPDTRYLDNDLSSSVAELCVEERDKAFVFPKNIDYHNALIYCLDHNQSKPKLLKSGLDWNWEQDGHLRELAPKIIPGVPAGAPNCRWVIREFSQLKMKTPAELGIGFGAGGGGQINLPDLNFNPIMIDIPTEQTCWISKEDKNAGPNLTNIWNPGNWLPIMYNCQNTIDGRPVPLHPINFIPIAIRLFAFITSLLIWLIVINIIVGIIMFIVGVAKSILTWVKNILIGSVAVVIVLILMYFILYLILSILQGSS